MESPCDLIVIRLPLISYLSDKFKILIDRDQGLADGCPCQSPAIPAVARIQIVTELVDTEVQVLFLFSSNSQSRYHR